MIVALFVVAAIVTTASWGISAQSIATAVAGRSAMSAELSAQVDTFNQTMAKAYAEATGWKGIAGSAAAKAAGFRLQADTEAGGSNGNGKGCGPICASYRDEAGSFANSKAELDGLLKEADDDRDQGEAAMSDLRSAAARSDQEAFIAAADHVDQSIEKLNAIDPTPIIRTTGAVHTSSKGIDLTKETAEFRADADKALANRKTVAAPTFTPMAIADATRRQMLGAAMHGWIMAGVIDLLPLLFLILAFAFSREVYLNEEVMREKVTHEGQDDIDRRRINSMLQRASTVVQFPGAGE